MLGVAVLYYRYTRDTPEGDFKDLRAAGKTEFAGKKAGGSFLTAARDPRVWALAAMYGACFGVELTINNVAALYFHDRFGLGLTAAGMLAGLHGLMNIFARSLGGMFGDRAGLRFGMTGRVALLGGVLLIEGLVLVLFARTSMIAPAIALFVVFSLFVEMGAGATYSVVPLINPRALGAVAGIVGAGGNIGAVAAGFMFRGGGIATETALLYLGIAVVAVSTLALLVPFTRDEPAAAALAPTPKVPVVGALAVKVSAE
jgi:MFS transporter, NNP family, nitrate/nitrite transporter